MSSEKLTVGDFGNEVARLHENLKKRGFEVSEEEIKRKFFGPTTRESVRKLQSLNGLEVSGEVNEATAVQLSLSVKDSAAPSFFSNIGSTPELQSPIARSRAASKWQIASTDGISLQSSEIISKAKSIETVDLKKPVLNKLSEQRKLEGRIVFKNGMPAENLVLRLYRLDLGGVRTQLGDETKTSELGLYSLPFNLEGKAAGLEISAVDDKGQEKPLSRQIYDLGDEERVIVNLVAPKELQPFAAEYQRLVDDMTPHMGERKALAKVRENDKQRDITLLNRRTGWDARLIALAAKAEKLNLEPEIQLSEEAIYGLLRAGLPSDKLQLAQVSSGFVKEALEKVRNAGIVSLTDEQLTETIDQFEKSSNQVLLKMQPPGSRSTVTNFLENSGLNDKEKQNKFANTFFKRSRNTDIWKDAFEAGLNDSDIETLQLQGKLAFLTGNSVEMSNKLREEINDPKELAEKDYFLASKWETKVRDAAGIRHDVTIEELTEAEKQKLQAQIPSSYAGEKIEDNFKAYTEDMARKVRLSYPTQVIGRMIEQDVADEFFKLGDARSDTAVLLKNAAAEGFRLGETSIETFITENSQVLNGINNTETAKHYVKTVQRVYQITPSDEAMKVLMKMGLTSAYDIANLSKEEFVEDFIRESPSLKEAKLEAELIFRKAQQVSSVTHNLFTIAKELESKPQIYGVSSTSTNDSLSASTNDSVYVPIKTREGVRNELIKQFPTMESLFGSMDFCDCEHCRSVLSPAAYLVDLLQFIDPNQEEWEKFKTRWNRTHDREYNEKYKKPYDALIERRPDIPYIPLTCENTHTVMPYIDIVNEILEYYVAHDKLTDDAAKDTGNATSEELLAEPQNIIADAYSKLQKEPYPLNLPFDLWIETVRSFCNYFEVTLPHLLEVFRPSDELFAANQPYDMESIFIESLGISPAEYAIFTDPNQLETDPNSLKNDKWYKLYGYTTIRRPVIGNPTNTQNATLTIPDEDAAEFSEGDLCTYFDVSEGTLYTETKEIREIGGPGSGGPGQTTITFVGVWKTDDNASPELHAPDAGDLLVFDAPNTLTSAKTLSRQLGVTYKELVEIVQTGFVNPELVKLVLLYKANMTIRNVMLYRKKKAFYEENNDFTEKKRDDLTSEEDKKRYDAIKKEDWDHLYEIKALEKKLASLNKKYPSSGIDFKKWLDKQIENNALDNILVLADSDASCNFDETTLKYASGKSADATAFVKINLFVRLWRKLGWTIEETDQALQAFVPTNAPFDANTTNLDKKPLQTALIYLAHFKKLNEQLSIGRSGRLKLITLWSNLPTLGKESLYSQLFLTRSMLKSGEVFDDVAKIYISVFDDPLGQYLTEAGLATMAERIRFEVSLENVKLKDKIDPTALAGHPKVSVEYDDLREVQSLAYQGMLTDTDKTQLAALSSSQVLKQLLDTVQIKAKEFTLIKGHMLTLQGALGLTADEITQIIADAGISIDTAPLSLENISLLYRYGLLAKALKLSIEELIVLKQLSGHNPFKPLSPDKLNSISEDSPFSETLRFIEIAGQVNESGLKIEDLDYLLRHRFDKTGKYRLKIDADLVLIKTLADGIRAIQTEHAVPPNPGAIDEETLRKKLSLALPLDVIDKFLNVMNEKIEFTVTKTGVLPRNKLNSETFKDEPSIRDVSYNDKDGAKVQKLVFQGILYKKFQADESQEKKRLKNLFPSSDNVFAELLDEVERQGTQIRLLLDNHLKKQKLSLNKYAGFLEESDLDKLFEPDRPLQKILPGDTEEQIEKKLKDNENIVQERRYCIAKAFLPFLQQRLIRQFITEKLAAQTGADPGLVEALLSDSRLLGGSQQLLEAFKATSHQGVNVTFFDQSGSQLGEKNVFVDVDTSLRVEDRKLKPAGTDRALFEGYLEVSTSGIYRFYVAFGKKDTEAKLWLFDKNNGETELSFDTLHQTFAPFLEGTAGKDGDEIGARTDDKSVELKPGIPYRFVLELKNLKEDEARLQVQGEILPKNTLAQLTLYSQDAIDRANCALTLLNKALQLIQGLSISEREIRYLLNHPDAFELDLNKLLPTRAVDTRAVDNTPEKAKILFAQFLRLSGYSRLKKDLAGGTDDLIEIFEALMPDQTYPLIAKLTRREENTVKEAAKALFLSPSFKNELNLQRVWEALQVTERFGVPVTAILGWTRIVSKTATPEQRFSIARDLKETIKARFEPEDWQKIAQPIFDKLRQKQRDALVAYVMHQHRFASMEQLYEYFLIDPGMEPVVQTSRIRLVISSLQLFIQRCLINLEKDVPPPALINSRHWEWMKHYRVWEANRKIFLFPENWLEPEFRDDKTHLFSELESNLLQGDVSNDLVEDAFLNYLKKLDELARLDIIAIHMEDNYDTGINTLHVIGRTFSQPHKYFYRRYTRDMWTPWEPVTAEIEGDHLAPVMWRDRLYLFWVTFMEKPEIPATSSISFNEAAILAEIGYNQGLLKQLEGISFNKEASITEAASNQGISKQQGKRSKRPDKPPQLVNMTLSEVTAGVMASAGKKKIEAQLHWSEYLQGKWSTRESGGLNDPSPVFITDKTNFDSKKVFIHVSKEYKDNEEGGVFIHLNEGGFNDSFYLAGRNSTPEKARYHSPKPGNPYSFSDTYATHYLGSNSLKVKFRQRITTEDNKAPVEPSETLDILGKCDNYTLVLCNNDINFDNPELSSLEKPLFYQDNAHLNTLFIEPSVEEQTIEEWKEWIMPTPRTKPERVVPDISDFVIPVFPEYKLPTPIDPDDHLWTDPLERESLEELQHSQDWLVNPVTGLQFDDGIIGSTGRIELTVLPSTEVTEAISNSGKPVNIFAGGDISLESTAVALGGSALKQASLVQDTGILNIIGSSGLNPVLAQNIDMLKSFDFGTSKMRSKFIRR